MDAVRFGAIVERLRLARGWTRKKLSQRAGLTPQYLAIVEQGGNVPSLTTVLELIEVLGADIAEVMRELMVARNSPSGGGAV
jgi:transcriptional regulator with XRE-family HTH domain